MDRDMDRTHNAGRGFTLIELMVVVAIIGLLAAIIVPSIATAMKSATRARAMSQITSLDGAIKRFYAEYGKMPLPKGVLFGDADQEFTGQSQAQILQILLNLDDATWPGGKRNTKQMVFLDLDPSMYWLASENRFASTMAEVELALSGGDPYLDPWKHPYGILLDLNMDDRITGTPYAGGDMRAKVGVYSLGEEGGANNNHPKYKTW